MHHNYLINLKVHVLNGRGPGVGEDWKDLSSTVPIHWHAGSRWRFSASVAADRCDLRLFDHAGLARLQGASALWRGRYALLIHGVEMWRSGRADYHRTARHAEALFSNSEYTARRTSECCPGLPPITVCWPGIDVPAAENRAGNEGIEGIGPHAMLIVGRLDTSQRHKGHDNLLEALPRVLESVPDAQLVVAGDGDDRVRLMQRAEELGVGRHVVFTGRVSGGQLHSLYKHCALFVMLSDGDGFGLVFLEAMMQRLPCVGLAGGAADEIFEHGVSGLLLDRDNQVELAESLTGLLVDGERRRVMGEEGFQRYHELFTGDAYARRFQQLVSRQLGID